MAATDEKLFLRLCTTPSIAAPSGSKARMFEHKDVRVRAGPLGARSAGKLRQHDVAETGVPGAMVLATFAETKVVHSRQQAEPLLERRTENDMDVETATAKMLDSGSRPLRRLVRNDDVESPCRDDNIKMTASSSQAIAA